MLEYVDIVLTSEFYKWLFDRVRSIENYLPFDRLNDKFLFSVDESKDRKNNKKCDKVFFIEHTKFKHDKDINIKPC